MREDERPEEDQPKEPHAAQATHEDICKGALGHYEELAAACHHWYNAIPKAIEFYREHGGDHNRTLTEVATEKRASAVDAHLRNKILARIDDIIKQSAWVDVDGSSIHEENFENLQIALSDYIMPLLRKAGWFVDEDDGLLTCITNNRKENDVILRKRTPEEREDYIHIKLAEWQLKDRFNSDKMRIAIATLRLLETSDRLTLGAVREIALKGLDDIASIGDPEADHASSV